MTGIHGLGFGQTSGLGGANGVSPETGARRTGDPNETHNVGAVGAPVGSGSLLSSGGDVGPQGFSLLA